MSAPEFVPTKAGRRAKAYESPPRRPDSWLAVRPGDLQGRGQPSGPGFGVQGPDQGYALTLARRLRDQLVLADGESADEVIAGCLGVALRRAALFGRAPVIDDLRLAFHLFGFLDNEAPADLIAFRRPLFAEVDSSHHYAEARELATLVPEEALRQTPDEVAARRSDWRSLLGQS
ncbi:MAG: hypothetical protein E6G39_17855 [Actinobacteria bacterium]|jgi:hypothetical protein|nr:MAG: hypothetical protein E6G39_17855 [Actinomycetota bacterium]